MIVPVQTGLVLEGGGLRGVYTAGVLRFFMDKGLYFPYVIGVSMGACNAANYVSRQPERNRIVNIRFVDDPRYLSYRRLLAGGDLFGMRFIFQTIPNELVPFDFDTFHASAQRCITTVTDCMTGAALYFGKHELGGDYLTVLRASASLPFLAAPVRYRGKTLMDGGLADAVPIEKSMADGNRRHVLVLTQPKGYRKKKSRAAGLVRLRYPRFKGLQRAFESRPRRYNGLMDKIDALENAGRVAVIRPAAALAVGRAERDPKKLYAAYDLGYDDAARFFSALCAYLA